MLNILILVASLAMVVFLVKVVIGFCKAVSESFSQDSLQSVLDPLPTQSGTGSRSFDARAKTIGASGFGVAAAGAFAAGAGFASGNDGEPFSNESSFFGDGSSDGRFESDDESVSSSSSDDDFSRERFDDHDSLFSEPDYISDPAYSFMAQNIYHTSDPTYAYEPDNIYHDSALDPTSSSGLDDTDMFSSGMIGSDDSFSSGISSWDDSFSSGGMSDSFSSCGSSDSFSSFGSDPFS